MAEQKPRSVQDRAHHLFKLLRDDFSGWSAPQSGEMLAFEALREAWEATIAREIRAAIQDERDRASSEIANTDEYRGWQERAKNQTPGWDNEPWGDLLLRVEFPDPDPLDGR